MNSPYIVGFVDGKNVAVKIIDDRIAELKAAPIPQFHATELITLEDIRQRIETYATEKK